jgi:hypothetical protein
LILIIVGFSFVILKNGITYNKNDTLVNKDIKSTTEINNEILNTVEESSEKDLDTISPVEKTEMKPESTEISEKPTETMVETSAPISSVAETISKYGENIVTNSGFEDGFSAWIKGTHISSESEISIANDTSYGGKNSFKIEKYNLTAYDYYRNEVTIKKDTSYLLECYCKMVDVVGDENESLSGTLFAADYGNGWEFANEKYTGSRNWTKISLKVKIPTNNLSDILRIKIGMRAATGTSYFDNVSIREIIE